MPEVQAKPYPIQSTSFESSAREVSIRLRDSLVEALSAVGADATRPQSIVAQLGINKILAWRLARVVTDDDPNATISRLPGNAAMRILTGALAKAGTPSHALDALRAATDGLDKLIQTHAGDRETLCMMLSGLSPEGQREREESARKLSFSGNSGTWGISAKVQMSSHFVAPGADPRTLDLARLGGFIELRRLRAQVPWPISTVYTQNDAGVSSPQPRWERIDKSITDPALPPLMPRFCSQPLPQVLMRTSGDGVTRYELAPGPVGNTAAITCITGRLTRGAVGRYRTADDALGEHLLHLTTPVEVVFNDLFVHSALAKEFVPRFFLYSQLGEAAPYPFDGRDRGMLPVCDDIIDLGGGPPATATPEIPRYREMAESAVQALGHALTDFHGYRVRMRYPPIPTVAVLRHSLAEPPAASN